MSTLVLLLLKIQIVLQCLIPVLRISHRCQNDLHIKFAPALLLNSERRVLELLTGPLAERLVEVVGCALETIGRHVVALGTDEVDADAPATHRDTVDAGGGIGEDGLMGYEFDCAFDLESFRLVVVVVVGGF